MVVVPPRLIPLPLLVTALAAAPAGPASAAGGERQQAKSVKGYVLPCFKADGQTVQFAVKPKRCVLADENAMERVLVPVTRLSWKTWTASRAKATGVVDGEGYSGKVGVVATKPKRCSATRVIFTSVTITVRLHGETGRLAQTTFACPA